MMRMIRDTAMEAHQQERTPRQRLRIWRRRFRARLEGCGIWQRSLTQAEMRERSRSRTSRASRTTTRRSLAEGEEEEPEAEESEQGETEEQQIERYRQSSMEEVSDPELWQSVHHWNLWWKIGSWYSKNWKKTDFGEFCGVKTARCLQFAYCWGGVWKLSGMAHADTYMYKHAANTVARDNT